MRLEQASAMGVTSFYTEMLTLLLAGVANLVSLVESRCVTYEQVYACCTKQTYRMGQQKSGRIKPMSLLCLRIHHVYGVLQHGDNGRDL
jgi:hypothetical protein